MRLLATGRLILNMLTELVAASPSEGALAAAYVGLFVNTAPSTATGNIGGLIEPTYTSYARIVLTASKWVAPSIDQDGSVVTFNTTAVHFVMGDANTPTTVVGMFLADAAAPGGNLLAVGQFDEPFVLTDVDHAINVIPVVRLPGSLDLGGQQLIG